MHDDPFLVLSPPTTYPQTNPNLTPPTYKYTNKKQIFKYALPDRLNKPLATFCRKTGLPFACFYGRFGLFIPFKVGVRDGWMAPLPSTKSNLTNPPILSSHIPHTPTTHLTIDLPSLQPLTVLQVKLTSVVGRAIRVPSPIPNPTPEQVEALVAEYKREVTRVYYTYRPADAAERKLVLLDEFPW